MFLLMFTYCSSAILKYLVTKYKLPDHWYPSDLQRRAKIDEYLGWHAPNLRMGGGNLIFYMVNILLYLHSQHCCCVT